VVDNGIKWRALSADFPPWRTVYGIARHWRADRVTHDLADDLRALIRRAAGRNAEPSAAVIDSQSVAESAEGVVGKATRCYDRHKNVSGRKRHLLVDTLGLLIAVTVIPANNQDRSATVTLVRRALSRSRQLARIWADSAYYGDWTVWAQHACGIVIDIVKRSDDQVGFQVLPRRWVVELANA
jgi:transposase